MDTQTQQTQEQGWLSKYWPVLAILGLFALSAVGPEAIRYSHEKRVRKYARSGRGNW